MQPRNIRQAPGRIGSPRLLMFIIVGLVAVIAIIVTVVLILNANSSSTAPTDGVDPFRFLVSFGAAFALAALFLFGLWLVRFLTVSYSVDACASLQTGLVLRLVRT